MAIVDVMEGTEVIPNKTDTGNRGRAYKPDAVENYIMEYMCSGMSAEDFATSRGIPRSTFYRWLKVFIKEEGCWNYKDHEIPVKEMVSGKIEDRQRNFSRSRQKNLRSAYEKEEIIKNYERSGMKMSDFAAENDIHYGSLREWLNRYHMEGIEGLKSRKLRNAGTYAQGSVTEQEMKELIKSLRIRILELEIRLLKLKEKMNVNIERGWEQHE